MAGSMALAIASDDENPLTIGGIRGQWEIQYSRFFNYPSLSSTHPSLSPIPPHLRKRHRGGTWISSSDSDSDSLASLKLLTTHQHSVILFISFRHKILEEHYISKLHFTWPQVSCIPGFPSRGSTVVLSSYKDDAGEIQKFALRFSTICQTQKFLYSLKEILEDASVAGLPCGNLGSATLSQSEHIPLKESPYRPINLRSAISSQSEPVPLSESSYRPIKDWSPTASANTFPHQISPRLNYEYAQELHPHETIYNNQVGAILSDFPPSFTSLLMSCPPVEQAQPTVSEDADLKAQIARCLEDSSFQDMLSKVQKVICEMGDDLIF